MIGLPHNTVRIDEHCAKWQIEFDTECKQIRSVLTGTIVSLEHIGSTAVPGLAAKPVIDILIGLESIEQVEGIVIPLTQIGYIHRGEHGIPNRHFFEKNDDRGRTHHIHAVEVDSTFHKEHLAFRDCLRTNPEIAKSYLELKEQLALKYPDGRNVYCDGKSEFIQAVLKLIL